MWSTTILGSAVLASVTLHLGECHGGMAKPRTWLQPRTMADSLYACTTTPTEFETKTSGCFWFTNFTMIPGERTLDPSLRSFPQLEGYGDPAYDDHPWMAPGSAPVYSPCGAFGGNPYGCHRAPPGGRQDTEYVGVEKECGQGEPWL